MSSARICSQITTEEIYSKSVCFASYAEIVGVDVCACVSAGMTEQKKHVNQVQAILAVSYSFAPINDDSNVMTMISSNLRFKGFPQHKAGPPHESLMTFFAFNHWSQ